MPLTSLIPIYFVSIPYRALVHGIGASNTSVLYASAILVDTLGMASVALAWLG